MIKEGNGNNLADLVQKRHEKLTLFTKDLIALCVKHGVELESDEYGLNVTTVGNIDRHVGTIRDVFHDYDPDDCIKSIYGADRLVYEQQSTLLEWDQE